MRERFEKGYLFSESGIHCPLCGSRMSRGSLFCGHCRRNNRFRVDGNSVRAVDKEVHLSRSILRLNLRHSA